MMEMMQIYKLLALYEPFFKFVFKLYYYWIFTTRKTLRTVVLILTSELQIFFIFLNSKEIVK